MKQNEKVLVYSVTGFLVVILAVAIVFGKEPPQRLPEGQVPMVDAGNAASLEDVIRRRAGEINAVPAADDKRTDPEAAPATGTKGAAEPALPGPAPAPAVGGSREGDVVPAIANQPLAANVQLTPPSPAAQVTRLLGISRREHDCRVVRARPGDSLGSLVQKWCGSTAEYLDQARALNEELTVLHVGNDVWLPWVDDEVLLRGLEATKVAAGPDVGAGAPTTGGTNGTNGDSGAQPPVTSSPNPLTPPVASNVTPPAPAAARKYRMKAGESLWRIGEREVGRNKIAAFLQEVRALNPGVDLDRLREGQEISLPR